MGAHDEVDECKQFDLRYSRSMEVGRLLCLAQAQRIRDAIPGPTPWNSRWRMTREEGARKNVLILSRAMLHTLPSHTPPHPSSHKAINMAGIAQSILTSIPGVDPRISQRSQTFSGLNDGPASTAARIAGKALSPADVHMNLTPHADADDLTCLFHSSSLLPGYPRSFVDQSHLPYSTQVSFRSRTPRTALPFTRRTLDRSFLIMGMSCSHACFERRRGKPDLN